MRPGAGTLSAMMQGNEMGYIGAPEGLYGVDQEQGRHAMILVTMCGSRVIRSF